MKTDFPEVKVTDIERIAEKVIAMKMRWPGLPIICAKRDIDSAFKRVRVHPDACAVLRAEFSTKHLGLAGNDDTALFYLALPFGWRASPGYFSRIGEGITKAHQQYASGCPERDGADPFSSQLFVDDAIFIEPTLGERYKLVVECWEHVCVRLLGPGAVNADKIQLEGQWGSTHILSGYEVNVDEMTIKLPKPKRMDAWGKINSPLLNPGNRVVTVKIVQEIRGLLNHWRYTNKFWNYVVSPANAMLAYADSTETWIRCDNDQVWMAFWNLVSHVREIGSSTETWNSLFGGKLEGAISIPKRIGRPRGTSAVIWATGDAVLEKFAAINWERSEFILEEADGFLGEI